MGLVIGLQLCCPSFQQTQRLAVRKADAPLLPSVAGRRPCRKPLAPRDSRQPAPCGRLPSWQRQRRRPRRCTPCPRGQTSKPAAVWEERRQVGPLVAPSQPLARPRAQGGVGGRRPQLRPSRPLRLGRGWSFALATWAQLALRWSPTAGCCRWSPLATRGDHQPPALQMGSLWAGIPWRQVLQRLETPAVR